jgi:hypothetical protein
LIFTAFSRHSLAGEIFRRLLANGSSWHQPMLVPRVWAGNEDWHTVPQPMRQKPRSTTPQGLRWLTCLVAQ